MEEYARGTRAAVQFIAVIVGIVAVLALVGTIIIAAQVSKTANELNGTSNSSSNCLSQGGSNPNC